MESTQTFDGPDRSISRRSLVMGDENVAFKYADLEHEFSGTKGNGEN